METLALVAVNARLILILLGIICEVLAGFNYTAKGKISFMPLGFAFFGAAFLA